MTMSGRVVLVTGALSGIGRAAAVAFARAGADVVISGRRDGDGEKLAGQLRAMGRGAAYARADVRQEDDVRSLIEFTLDQFGRVDAAVNSAGFEGVPGPLLGQSVDNYVATFEANVLGVFLCLKHQLAVMREQRQGSIVNLSSTMGHKAASGMSIYVASKHAVEGLTKAAALEAASYGVRVNAIAPGPTATEMLARLTPDPARRAAMTSTVPLGRVATAEEVAEVILFVASDKASFVTGQVLCVDGGKSAT
jgi:NAD(P)-dependent dehydrogenase (short-subunit alcohol dehydrogenase family)